MNLREYLEMYRDLTLSLINEVEKDEELTDLIQKREDLLRAINILNFDKDEIKAIGDSLKLLELEEELQVVIKKEKVKVKREIEKLKVTRQANTNYNNIEYKSRVFNKSI